MNLLSKVVLVIGIISLLYYGVIVNYAGFQSSFAWLWLLAGVGCILAFIVMRLMIIHGIKLGKPLYILAIAAFVIGFSIFAFVEGMIVYHENKGADPGIDYIIVLGAQVRGDRITRSLKERLDKAITYLKENPSTIAIVSGGRGKGENLTEAEAMKRYLTEHNIAGSRIIKEDKSTNTNENILYSKEFITKPDAKVAVVTNGFHVFRAKSIAKKQGLTEIQGLSAPSDPVLFVNYYVREFFGVLKDWIFGNL